MSRSRRVTRILGDPICSVWLTIDALAADVGGYGKDLPERSTRPGLKSLRLGRKLLTGMVVSRGLVV